MAWRCKNANRDDWSRVVSIVASGVWKNWPLTLRVPSSKAPTKPSTSIKNHQQPGLRVSGPQHKVWLTARGFPRARISLPVVLKFKQFKKRSLSDHLIQCKWLIIPGFHLSIHSLAPHYSSPLLYTTDNRTISLARPVSPRRQIPDLWNTLELTRSQQGITCKDLASTSVSSKASLESCESRSSNKGRFLTFWVLLVVSHELYIISEFQARNFRAPGSRFPVCFRRSCMTQ